MSVQDQRKEAEILEIEAWIESKRTSTWADWFVQAADRRRLAAEWFHKEVNSFLDFHEEQYPPQPMFPNAVYAESGKLLRVDL